jgi:MinD superfamily P-loop ATPase
MKELVVISGKGGTGKTSLVGALAYLADSMVLADCDVDAADLYLLLAPDIETREDFYAGGLASIDTDACISCGRCRELCRFDAIDSFFHVDPLACEGCGVCVWNCPVDAISFSSRKSGELYHSHTRVGPMVHARMGAGEENSGKLVTRVRQDAKEIAEQKSCSLILVDGPPGVGCPVIATVGGVDLACIVTEPTRSAIHDMKRVISLVEYFGIRAAVVINKWDINPELVHEIETYCQQQNLHVLGKIPYHPDVTRAQVNGKPIMDVAPKELADQYHHIWTSLQRLMDS